MVNEFGLSDVETAYWLGVQSWLLVIFGMLGAVLVNEAREARGGSATTLQAAANGCRFAGTLFSAAVGLLLYPYP